MAVNNHHFTIVLLSKFLPQSMPLQSFEMLIINMARYKDLMPWGKGNLEKKEHVMLEQMYFLFDAMDTNALDIDKK